MKKPSALRLERELRGWSQARVAEELNVTSKTVARWEQGLVMPYPYYREQLCTLFGKNVRELGLLPERENDEMQAIAPSAASPPPQFLFDPVIPEAPGNANSLLGRDALLAQIKQHLLENSSLALTALNGLPGIGKTALAMTLVADRDIQAQYCDGILWASLGPHPNIVSLLARWGSLLDIRAEEVESADNPASWWRALHAAIGSRRMLLVIDDVWSAEDTQALLVGGNNCALLITTRLPQVAFAFAQWKTVVVPELMEADGLALLARYVPQFIEQDREAARELVRVVGGLPLAVKLMGYHLASQALSGQPRRLRAAITALQDAQQRMAISIPARWQEHSPSLPGKTPLSLQAAIAISDQHLSRQAHTALCALAVFPAKPNSFSEEAALAVCQQPAEILDELWDIGLLEACGPGRYMLHQTVVDYARSQGQDVQCRQQLVFYTVQYLQMYKHDYENIEREINNLQAGLDSAIGLQMHQELFVAITSIVAYMSARSHYALADYYLQEAFKNACQQKDQEKCMLLLQHLADFAKLREEHELAESYILKRAHERRENR